MKSTLFATTAALGLLALSQSALAAPPDMGMVQKTVGRAQPFVYNLPATKALFVRTLGWCPWLLHGWAQKAVQLAREIQPQLIRCHGPFLNAFVAYRIKQELGIPYLVSMHINPDEDIRGRSPVSKRALRRRHPQIRHHQRPRQAFRQNRRRDGVARGRRGDERRSVA